jgi:signal transduction histidine kinase
VPRILGDETQISQVLVNLVVNAFQAMPDGGTCDITAGGVRTDQREWLQISVRDSGAGINQEHMERLFEPFYTTKSGGSGLGLAVAYRIVHDHGGTIQVRSMPGCGTTVVVTFPAAAAAAREASLCP